MCLPLPEISEEESGHGHGILETSDIEKPSFHKPLIKQSHFVTGVIAQFCLIYDWPDVRKLYHEPGKTGTDTGC